MKIGKENCLALALFKPLHGHLHLNPLVEIYGARQREYNHDVSTQFCSKKQSQIFHKQPPKIFWIAAKILPAQKTFFSAHLTFQKGIQLCLKFLELICILFPRVLSPAAAIHHVVAQRREGPESAVAKLLSRQPCNMHQVRAIEIVIYTQRSLYTHRDRCTHIEIILNTQRKHDPKIRAYIEYFGLMLDQGLFVLNKNVFYHNGPTLK